MFKDRIQSWALYVVVSLVLLCTGAANAHSEAQHLISLVNQGLAEPPPVCDRVSLQRGAAVFMHYCAGCHSLSYARYGQVAHGLGIPPNLAMQLNLSTQSINDSIISPLPKELGAAWFGVSPPDLTLVARVRGRAWLQAYLMGFYQDETRPWGVNNVVFPTVAMPHALIELQGLQKARFNDEGFVAFDPLKPGLLSQEQYAQLVGDLVNFLDYMGEPHQLERKRMGVYALLFLAFFGLLAYLLKREYWKDIH